MDTKQMTVTTLGDYPAFYTPLRQLTPLEMALRAERLYWETQAKYVTILRYDIVPFPKQRTRGTVIRLKTGKSVVKLYTPDETLNFEENIRTASAAMMADMQVIDGARLGAKVDFITDGKNEDLDNLIKSLLDGMQGAVFSNDNAFDYLAPMRYVTKSAPPHIIALILKK